MAKQAGLGDRLLVGGYDLSGDIGSLGAIAGGPAALELTGIDKSAKERAGGIRDGRIEFNSWFNPSVGQEHDVLSALPTADVGVTYLRGAAVGNEAAFMTAKQVNYDSTRGEDGSLEWAIAAQANGFGLEWGKQATAGLLSLSASATHTSASQDAGAATVGLGATLFVQVGAYVTTLVSITLQQSSDDGAGDPFADVASMQVPLAGSGGPSTARVATVANLERYLRLRVSGTYTSLTVQATIARRTVATVF